MKWMKTSAVMLGAIFCFTQAKPVDAQTFHDVPKSHWAKSVIEQVTKKGYVTGYPDGTFRPSKEVTRAEFATFLARMLDGKVTTSSSFADVPSGHWAKSAIDEGISLGFINSDEFPNNRFEPDKPLTRAEMAKWMANGLAHVNSEYKQAIKDTKDTLLPIPEYYKGGLNKGDIPYIAVALGTGLLTGYTDETFKPKGKTTRAEVAAIMVRYLNTKEKSPDEFFHLREFREVGTTGTNMETTTKYRAIIPFSNARGKDIRHYHGIGYIQLHRLIFLDGVGYNNKSAYAKMFGPAGKETIYTVFVEKSFRATVPIDRNFSKRYSDDRQVLTTGQRLIGDNVKWYGLRTPPADIQEFYKFFEQGQGKTYWEALGITRDDNHYSIMINDKTEFLISNRR